MSTTDELIQQVLIYPKSYLKEGERLKCKHCGSRNFYALSSRGGFALQTEPDNSIGIYEVKIYMCRRCGTEFNSVPTKAASGLLESMRDPERRMELLRGLLNQRK